MSDITASHTVKTLVEQDGHCPVAEYQHQVPMPLGGRLQSIDYCVADIVAALNATNIRTVWSCCGHGTMDAQVGLEDGRTLVITKDERP